MRRRLVIVGIVGFWCVMMATLVRRWLLEVRPEFLPGTYRSLLTPERQDFRSRMGIYLNDGAKLKRLGYTQTLFIYREDAKYDIENVTQAELPVPGILQDAGVCTLTTKVRVGKNRELEALLLLLDSALGRLEVRGHVHSGSLVLRVADKGKERTIAEVPVPSGEVVAQGLSPLLALPPLKVGMRWTVMTIDPLKFRTEPVNLEVTKRERIEWQGELWDTHLVVVTAGVFTSRAWVTLDGEVIQESLPFRVMLIKEPIPTGEPPRSGRPTTKGAL